ncbi:MAG TPA: hypothetical protein VFC00_36795 [Micromonosporaceae bacterium]|nr:hypothetical protein [Micromonosporaceae bacterium]
MPLIPLVVAVPLVLAFAGVYHPADLTTDTADTWRNLHLILLPVFPLLAAGPLLLLRGIGGPVAALARVAAYSYAVFYTALDAIAGIAAGAVVAETEEEIETVEPQLHTLFDIGNLLGIIGSVSFLLCAASAATALVLRYGRRAIPGAALFVLASVPFLFSHIYWPVGGSTLVVMAVGLGLLAWARVKSSTVPSAGPSS